MWIKIKNKRIKIDKLKSYELNETDYGAKFIKFYYEDGSSIDSGFFFGDDELKDLDNSIKNLDLQLEIIDLGKDYKVALRKHKLDSIKS
jgi:hypothetical protein